MRWHIILGLLISGVCLYISVRNLQPAEVLEAFKRAHYFWTMPAVLLYLLALGMRTCRWQVLLSSEGRISFRNLLPTMAIGRGANNIYPFRTGEIVRVLLLRRRNMISAAAGLASVLVERVFDGLTMLLFLTLAALIGGIPDYLRYIAWGAMALFGGALVFIYAIVLWPDPIQRVLVWGITHVTPKRLHQQLTGMVGRFIGGFAAVRSVGNLTLVLFFSLCVWSLETLSYRLMMNAFDFGVDLHYLLLMSGAANLGTALPSGPGNLGTFDAPAILVLTQTDVSRDVAVSYQAVLHAVLWSTETFAGLFFMLRQGLKKKDLQVDLDDPDDEIDNDSS